MAYETIIVTVEDHVALIKLNRPDALNALNNQLMQELAEALGEAQTSDKVRCIVLTGSEKAFAAGADIKMMSQKSFVDVSPFVKRSPGEKEKYAKESRIRDESERRRG